ncbi:MAG TPA: hypothetical protein VMI75_22895, partial [Polyangiaceae bacterium]|nr:hypothetical protein [Polyangiaceae bacterium]
MLQRVFDVRPGEGRLVAPAMVVALLVVASQVLAVIVSDTVFVTAFDLGQLSGFIVVAAIARVILTLGYGAVARWAHAGPLRGVALGIVGAMTCALALALVQRGSSPAVVYAACTALLAVPVAAQEAVSVSIEAFPARQGKRLVPLVAASSSIGGMIAGVFARGLSVRMGAPNLLWIAGALLVVAALVSRLRSSAVEAHEVDSSGVGSGGSHLGIQELRTLPIVRVAVALALLVAVTNSVSDFAFKATLKSAFARDQMAAFVGVFEAALSASVIVAQLFLTARLGARLGVRATLQVYPTAVALAAPAFALAPRVATATTVKLAESLARFGLVTPMRAVFIAPLAPATRARASLLVRGVAVPLGSVIAGVALGAYGASGAPPRAIAAMLVLAAAAALGVLAFARRAYAQALARSLGEGRLSLDVPPAQAAALHEGLRRMLGDAAARGDLARASQVLALLGEAATREDVGALLALPPSADAAIERQVLAAARRAGMMIDRARLRRIVEGTGSSGPETAALRFDALSIEAADGQEGRERLSAAVEQGLASADVHLFAAAATAAVRLDASRHVPRLVSHLDAGPHFGAAGRALVLAGDAAIEPLLQLLPRSRSRAARVLTRLGPRACRSVLERWRDLDHRARAAASRALSVLPDEWRPGIEARIVDAAVDATLESGEALAQRLPDTRRSRVLQRELRLRLASCAEQALDLASMLGDRARIGKARAALARDRRARADALELLEEVLPRPFARRTLSMLEADEARPAAAGSPGPDANGFDGWLETCASYDRGALSSPELVALLDKLVVLGESSLFSGMTSEDLYPVGQIATVV